MATTYEIPLVNEAQTFKIALAGINYALLLVWNEISNSWTLDISQATDNNTPILRGVPLVANSDLLSPYAYMNWGGQLIARTDGNADAAPTYDNLGTLSHLYFIVI